MKKLLIIGIALIVGICTFMIIRNADQKKQDIEELCPKPDIKDMDLTKPDEFVLFTDIHYSYEEHFFELYHDDQLVYKGKYEIDLSKHNTGWMFMGNMPKKDSTKLRLKSRGIDTVFYATTINIEYLLIVLTEDKRLLIWNDKNHDPWLID